MTGASLVDRLLAGDPRAMARAISVVETGGPPRAALLGRIYPHTGRAYVLGITGPPGAGKSTLVDQLITRLRADGRRVGVLAVDPTSPFSGGAILGDRIRMQTHAEDAGVFVRSMATRGRLGGLSAATADAALVLDAAGCDVVLIETVGVGQDEIDVIRTADVTLVLVMPGAGDDVQALKAGIMEIADIFVVNKADREGADRTAAAIEGMLSLALPSAEGWRPPILRTTATTGEGVAGLVQEIERFREATRATGEGRRRARAEFRLREVLAEALADHVERHVLRPGERDELLDRIARREIDPYGAARELVQRTGGQGSLPSGPVIDHIGVAVRDSSEILAFLEHALGLVAEGPGELLPSHVRVRFVQAGGAAVELVEPAGDGSPVVKFLEARGPGLHHVAFRVEDLQGTLAALEARGVSLIDRTPRPGAHGTLIAFVHPSSAGGVLVELVGRAGP